MMPWLLHPDGDLNLTFPAQTTAFQSQSVYQPPRSRSRRVLDLKVPNVACTTPAQYANVYSDLCLERLLLFTLIYKASFCFKSLTICFRGTKYKTSVNVFLTCIVFYDAGPGCDQQAVGRFLTWISSYIFLPTRHSFDTCVKCPGIAPGYANAQPPGPR